VSSDLTDYYRGSSEYRAMLAEQDESLFEQYLSYFGRWAEPAARVLDVGCGVGTTTRLLREAGFDAVGTDTSARFLPDEPGFFVADFARRTDLQDGAFAAAGALNVIEHVADPRAFLDELVRVVRPGGLVVICSPNLTSPLVGARILVDLTRGRTPYLGVRSRRAATRSRRASTRWRPGWSATTPTRPTGATPPRFAAGWSGSAASWSPIRARAARSRHA
jgi:SAM-dependent methyltransferase